MMRRVVEGKMLAGVIDVGSNSVRLMMWQDGKNLYKRINTTRLGEGTATRRTLLPEAISRTVDAVTEFVSYARKEGAERVYAYATEAVRSADNRLDFLDAVREACGVDVEVLSGSDEAVLGALGALGDMDGAVIDVGGASSEVTLVRNGEVVFARSFPIGTVRLFDCAGRDHASINKQIEVALDDVIIPDASDLCVYSIGGTATSLAAVSLALEEYDSDVVNGTTLTLDYLDSFSKKVSRLPVDEVKTIKGMDVRRADVIGGGAQILIYLARRLGTNCVIVSESDNLEGYMMRMTR